MLGVATVLRQGFAHAAMTYETTIGVTKRALVLGNHDSDPEALREAGFATQCSLALCATDPPLAPSDYPLRQVPLGAVNGHGDLHDGTELPRRHLKLAVEQLDYSPMGLVWVLDQAREPADSRPAMREGKK